MKQHSIFCTTIIFVFAISAHRVSAAEAVGMELLQDGKHIAGFTVTYAGESEAEIWLKLKDIRLTFERDFSMPLDSDDSRTATLTGSIELRTHRRGDAGTGITTDQLQLVRRGPTDWYLTDSEVDRTLKVSGLKMPTKQRTLKPVAVDVLWLVPVCLIGLIVAIMVLVLSRRRSRVD